MVSFITRFVAGWERANANLTLAAVPLVIALLNTDAVTAVLSAEGWQFGFKTGLPLSIVDLWKFVSVPTTGINSGISPLFLVFVLLQAGLAAGYFGSIRDLLDETSSQDFWENVLQYFVPFLVYTLFLSLRLRLVGESGIPGGFIALIVLLPISFLLIYLFYATPYLLVLRDTGLVSALGASFALAVSSGPYLRFAIGFSALVLLSSVGVSVIVVNLGVIGIVLGAIVAAPVGLTANLTTMQFIADIDPESSLETGAD